MAGPHVLAAAAALLLLRSAVGLDARPARPRSPGSGRHAERTDDLNIGDVAAAGRDADEEDDFDTWYFQHAGDDDSRFSAGFESDGPEKKGPDPEEKSRATEAWGHCHQGYLSHGAVPLENGVIVYLVTRQSDLNMLWDGLSRLRYFILTHWAYDVKVFVPSKELREYDPSSFAKSPSRERVMKVAQEVLGNDTYNFEVEDFDLTFPKVIADDDAWEGKMNDCAKAVSTSYKHMNQFFTKAMYQHPALDKYKYYLRIDADFYFKAGSDGTSIQADPFCMMAKTGRKFMWQTRRQVKNQMCTEGLWEWFEEYQQAQDLTPGDPVMWNALGARVNYVGYVGMGDLDFFRSGPVRRLSKALNEDGRVYLNRWSDQTYYVLLFALFENHSAVGDIGFDWRLDSWCHKCFDPRGFNPLTGESYE